MQALKPYMSCVRTLIKLLKIKLGGLRILKHQNVLLRTRAKVLSMLTLLRRKRMCCVLCGVMKTLLTILSLIKIK
ncbi:hypothetical protein Gotur_000048 [Gossypium turneri]